MGRSWVSKDGNLYASLLLELLPGERASELSFVAALAVYHAAEMCLPSDAVKHLKLKWPNDLLLAGEKAAGILLEQAGSSAIAIGCGLNLGNVPKDGTRTPATGLALHGATEPVATALEHLAVAMDHWINIWRSQTFVAVRAAWLERAMGQGELINVSQGSEQLTGVFETLDEHGALILQLPCGKTTRILAADIELAA